MSIRLGNQYQTPDLNEMELIFSLVILKAKARLVENPFKSCGLRIDNLKRAVRRLSP